MSIIADDNDFEYKKEQKKNPVVKPEAIDCDKNFENCIRPKSFDTYIGQSALKDTLKITIQAAKKREHHLTICYFTDHRDLVKQHLQEKLLKKWV